MSKHIVIVHTFNLYSSISKDWWCKKRFKFSKDTPPTDDLRHLEKFGIIHKILSHKNQVYKRLEVLNPYQIKLLWLTIKKMKVISIFTGIFATVNGFSVPKTLSKYDFEVIKNLQFQNLDFAAIRKDFDKAPQCECYKLPEWGNIVPTAFSHQQFCLDGSAKYSSFGYSCRNTKLNWFENLKRLSIRSCQSSVIIFELFPNSGNPTVHYYSFTLLAHLGRIFLNTSLDKNVKCVTFRRFGWQLSSWIATPFFQ